MLGRSASGRGRPAGHSRPEHDRLRREHDHADLRASAGRWPAPGSRGTKSSSRGWITTPTSRPGCWPHATPGPRSSMSAFVPMIARWISTSCARNCRRARGWSRSAAPRTPWGRSTRSPRSSSWPTTAGAQVFLDAVHYAPHRLDRRRGVGLRLPGLLGLQVLRPACRHFVGTARAA